MEPKVFRNRAVDYTQMKNECVLFHPETNQFCLLNTTATFVWDLLDRPQSVPELAHALCSYFEGVSVAEAVRDVEQTVGQFEALDLVSTQL